VEDRCDIAIIGAGAAGLAAGIFAAEAAQAARAAKPRIVILDGAKTIGAKILVSGGGRCNVTHDQIRPEDYFASRTIVRNVLAAFGEKATVRWMESIGVPLKREETGKLFPVSDSAKTVVAALLGRLHELGVEIRAGCRVTGSASAGSVGRASPAEEIPHSDSSSRRAVPALPPIPCHAGEAQPHEDVTFIVFHSQGELRARSVILCTGGKSLPRTGSDGAGWAIARRLGHTVTDTSAALVPLVLDDKMFHADVMGLSHEVELSTFVEGKRIDRRTGSLLWTHFGISGPVVMDASRFWVIAHDKSQLAEVRCNFLPGETFESVEKAMVATAAARPKLSVGKAVAERLPERLRLALIRHAGVDPATAMGQLSRDARRALVHALTALPLPILRDRGWNYAEVTAGGVPLDEIDFRTMASRKVPGLFLAGEILDCDGRIGGFNFQWAWATGYLAGRAAARVCT
jgi:hypothetical protein